MRRILMVCIIGLVMAGCLPVVQPDTYQQRLAYAAGSISAARASCADHYLRSSMTRENAEKCLVLTDQAMELIQAARLSTGTESQLTAALAILVQVENLTRAKEGK